MSRGVPITALSAAPSANGAGGISIPFGMGTEAPSPWPSPRRPGRGDKRLLRSSTATVTRAAVVAEVAIAVSHGDGTAAGAGGGVGLEAGELLVAVRGCFQTVACRTVTGGVRGTDERELR